MGAVPILYPYELVLGIVISSVLFLLSIIRLARSPRKKHNFVFLFLFACGLCHALSYFTLLHGGDEYSSCTVDTLTYVSFYSMRFWVMVIYYLRLDPLIGVNRMYFGWIRYFCILVVLSGFLVPISLRLYNGRDISWCSWTFFCIIISTRTIPSIIFLVLFLAPLCQFINPTLRKLF